MPNPKRQLAAIMFTDIVGYTSLMGKDSSRAIELVRQSVGFQKPLVEKHDGKWLKEIGDGVLAQFSSALDAVNCAFEIQETARAKFDGMLRIGIHLGDITFENNDVYGDGVNVAARLESIADPGGIYISDAIEKSFRGQSNIQAKYLGEITLRNVDYAVRTYSLQGAGLPVPSLVRGKNLSGQFLAEIQRRGVLRAGLVYIFISMLLFLLIPYIKSVFTYPDWGTQALIWFLAVLFPVAIYLAWKFERSPEGFVSTSSKESWRNPYSYSQRKPLTGNIIIALLILFNLFIIISSRYTARGNQGTVSKNKNSITEKSIAALPFKNLSEDQSNQHFCDGMMEGILNHLSQIKDLRVLSRNSTEKYRKTSTLSPQIAEELNVSYLIDASVFKSEDRIRVTAQLIDARNDEDIWSKQYDREISDIFNVMSDISQEVASEIEVVITPHVKERIESIPTENQVAYDYYLRGIEFQNRYYSNGNVSDFKTAIHFFKEAIELDPEFALAYVESGWTYVGFAGLTELIKESYLDTVKFFSTKALSIDPDLSEGYVSLGWYYYAKGNLEKSIENYEKAIDLNPNSFLGYWNLADSYKANSDYVNAITNYKKVKKLVIGTEYYTSLLRWLGNVYQDISYYDKAEAEYLELVDFDPLTGYLWLSFLTAINRKWDKMNYYVDQICAIDSGNNCWQVLQNMYYYKKDFTNAYMYFEKSQEAKEELNLGDFNWWWNNYLYAYILYNLNKKEEALMRFRKQIEMSEESIRLKRELATGATGGFAYYAMAASYLYLGEKDKAYETLHEMERNAFSGWYTWKIQVDPVFESLWKDDEFKQIIQRQERKYSEIRAKIDRLEEQGLL